MTFRHRPDGAGDRLRVHQGHRRTVKSAVAVEEFVEKPDEATAARYLEDGGYFWNSGMFLFKRISLPG